MDFSQLHHHFADGKYEDLTALLQSDQIDRLQIDPVCRSLLDATAYLASACAHARHEVARNRELLDQALEQQADLQAELEKLLVLVQHHHDRTDSELAPGPVVEPQVGSEPEAGVTSTGGFWQRLKGLFTGDAQPLQSMSEPSRQPRSPKHQPFSANGVAARNGVVFPPSASTVQPTLLDRPDPDSGKTCLEIFCFGTFRVIQNGRAVDEWPSSKGKLILQYLAAHRQTPVHKDVLMTLHWPEADPDSARNNLNVAIHGLRKSLRNGSNDFSHILFENDSYLLNPEMDIWLDLEQFMAHFHAAQNALKRDQPQQALPELLAAELLYEGELFAEDRYGEWLIPYRQELQSNYLHILEELCQYYQSREDYVALDSFSRKLLEIEPCHEETHRRLMRSFSRRNHHHLALRQYQLCCATLEKELDVAPSAETCTLYEQIRNREFV